MKTLQLLLLCLLVSLFTGCDSNKPVPAIPEKKSNFQKTVFTQLQSERTITLVSETECEINDTRNILLVEYSRQDNKLRVVTRAGGAASVSYFDLLPEGLRADGVVFLLPEPLAKARAEIRAAQEAQATLKRAALEELKKSYRAPAGIAMVWIAPGSFQMGDATGNGDGDEKPVHEVRLSAGYWLGESEVTQGQWQAVMGNNPSHFNGDALPVESVSWDEAVAFCRKLTESERAKGKLPAGLEYRLPTEAQWEYGCRAGTTGDYAGELDSMAWYDSNSGRQTHEVKTKRPNAWGLYDMHGNVREWCSDQFRIYPAGTQVDPTGATDDASRVYRGGSWDCPAGGCRSASRDRYTPGVGDSNLGFRLAAVLSSE